MHELLIIYLSSFSDLTVSTAGAEPFIHLMQCSMSERSSPFRVKLSLARGAYIEQMQLSSVVLCSSVRCPGVGKAAPCSVALATRRHSEFNH